MLGELLDVSVVFTVPSVRGANFKKVNGRWFYRGPEGLSKYVLLPPEISRQLQEEFCKIYYEGRIASKLIDK